MCLQANRFRKCRIFGFCCSFVSRNSQVSHKNITQSDFPLTHHLLVSAPKHPLISVEPITVELSTGPTRKTQPQFIPERNSIRGKTEKLFSRLTSDNLTSSLESLRQIGPLSRYDRTQFSPPNRSSI